MVKVVGPALSLGAHGTLGKALTFQKRLKGNTVYLKSHPGRISSFNLSYNQYQNKVYVSEGVRYWHLLSGSEQGDWDEFVE